jgi:ubiquinone/menaquinone biosynthesis C-methylase UbiE
MKNWFYNEYYALEDEFTDRSWVADYDRNQTTPEKVYESILDRLGICGHLVDMGAGTGNFVLAAARRCNQVYAVDVSGAMLEQAYHKAQQAGLDHKIKFIQSSFLTYEHTEAAVDCVVTRYTLHHLPDFWKSIGLQHIKKMLRPGGMFYLRDIAFSFPIEDYRAEIDRWIEQEGRPGQSGFTAADYEEQVREEHPTFTWILEALLQHVGFEIVEQNYLSSTHAEYLCQRT